MEKIEEATIDDLRSAMDSGDLSAVELVDAYVERIRRLDRPGRDGPGLGAVIELNPDAAVIAEALDGERRARGPRGPLHGIPILLKDNIDTGDLMQTTAGSLALVGDPAREDAVVARRLREAGAVILGKTNLSEWANFRSSHSFSGWSGRGGRTRNPYALDRNPSGSSSGSAVAVSANLCAVAIGTETDGSIVSPANACGVVGVKPTVGLTSRTGVIPISATQDTLGPMARTVADAAITLASMAEPDRLDPAPLSGVPSLFRADGLRGARIGVLRAYWGRSEKVDRVMDEALRALREAGAVLVDPVELPSWARLREDDSEMTVLVHEFRDGLEAYLASREGIPVRTVAGLVEFNRKHAAEEMPWFGQELLEAALAAAPLDDPGYLAALATSRRLGGEEGIDAAIREHRLDALVAPSGGPARVTDVVNGDQGGFGSSGPAARAGYPLVSVPAGMVLGLPVGLTFMGPAGSEPTLLRLAHAFEQYTAARRPPRFLASIERADA